MKLEIKGGIRKWWVELRKKKQGRKGWDRLSKWRDKSDNREKST